MWTSPVRQVFLFLLLSLNWLLDFKFVTTNGDERPTPQNSTAIQEGDEEGRGSLVYFNQASMYRCSELDGNSVKEAIQRGESGKTDYGRDAQKAFGTYAKYLPISL